MRFLFSLALALGMAGPAIAGAATVSHVGGVEIIVDGAAPAVKLATPASAGRARRAAAARKARASALAAATRRRTLVARAVAGPAFSSTVSTSRWGAAIIRNAMAYLGTPYVWGGSSPGGFDCSGYTQYVFRQTGITIPRTADIQFAAGRQIAGYPEPGDLVFFQTYDYGASHVGIYIGNGWFVQEIAPNVHLSNFNSPYFRSRYIGARRLTPA